ncbi:hypothetical protein DSM112329_02925 [Paraconexibacter sp. AEG42_29]|uniref:Uncharacterized protein n=1 Tax=Paraconexibacter sp. AEG42_29 TaxID=2997339 RepID=A0AAU7AWJ1_9ACTN
MRPGPVSPRLLAAGGLALAMAGGLAAVASLWSAWAVDGTERRSGWSWMQYGDVLLLSAAATILVLVLVVGTGAGRGLIGTLAAVAAILLIAAATVGVMAVVVLTEYSLAVFDDDAARPQYLAGPGPGRAGVGLALMLAGVLTALLARTTRERRASPSSSSEEHPPPA